MKEYPLLFSVVLCVNKNIPYLKDAIISVLTQEYIKDFEFIIVANNCENELYEYLQTFTDPRIKLFRTKIGQLSFNLNYAVNFSSGEYIVRMDADDISLVNRLATTEKIVLEYQPDVVGFSAMYVNETCVVIGESKDYSKKNIEKLLMRKNPFIHPTVAIKKDTLLSVGGYLGGRQSEDYDLWIRLSKVNGINFIISPIKVLKYRITEEQSRGNVLPYCEVASYFLREFLISWKPKYLLALLITVGKRIILPRK
jgi:glycosyltransferase involved in cell wall biosynthesis